MKMLPCASTTCAASKLKAPHMRTLMRSPTATTYSGLKPLKASLAKRPLKSCEPNSRGLSASAGSGGSGPVGIEAAAGAPPLGGVIPRGSGPAGTSTRPRGLGFNKSTGGLGCGGRKLGDEAAGGGVIWADARPATSISKQERSSVRCSMASVHMLADRGQYQSHDGVRSEEHTSELQSQSNLVCRPLLEK